MHRKPPSRSIYLRPMKESLIVMFLTLGILGLTGSAAYAQPGTIQGKVIDPINQPISDAKITVEETGLVLRTGSDGSFRMTLPANKVYHLLFSHVAHQSAVLELRVDPGRVYDRTIKLLDLQSEAVEIIGEIDPTSIDDRDGMLVNPISLEKSMEIPIPTASVEQLAKLMPGVSTNSEFSSQYQVRGGNFDENLVYVNGIEIYRPFLARSGQQEGLGFSNASMAQGLKFSTGGFGAQYGDKMSSVLDITYRQPTRFRATGEVGILTTNLHVEGTSKNKIDPDKPGKFTYLMGARRFSMAYLLNSLDTRGEYRPLFLDYQGMFTYTPKEVDPIVRYKERKNGRVDTIYSVRTPIKITGFITTSRNQYLFEPVTKETTFGTIQQAFRLLVAFEGRELSAYTTSLGAVMLEHQPSTRLKFDYIVTAFNTLEEERFDVEGGYLLGQVNTNFGSDEFNEAEFDLGIGSQFRHARNFLNANVLAGQFRGRWFSDNNATHKVQFGAKIQYQTITDDLKEYAVLDSAGYLVDSLGRFGREEYIRGSITLNSFQYSAFVQHDWQVNDAIAINTGIRAKYYDLIDATMISPRVQILWKLAEELDGETKLRIRLASGLYYQPPFYREFRRFDGTVNLDVKPQRSLHFIAGMDYRFYGWGRPFRLFAEAYYKDLANLIPYEVQNVRIRYYPDEVANGYAYGIDARLNGEFIKGVDSWLSVGLLNTKEDILGDEEGYVSRPTDQRFTFSMFFQDELPINPTYKVQMTYVYGSGLRFGPPNTFEDRTAYTFPPYHRFDIGFSKLISILPSSYQKVGLESIWGTFEIFNLLQRENTVSYVWVKDLQNNSFAVPNYLSARLLNFRVIVKFK